MASSVASHGVLHCYLCIGTVLVTPISGTHFLINVLAHPNFIHIADRLVDIIFFQEIQAL